MEALKPHYNKRPRVCQHTKCIDWWIRKRTGELCEKRLFSRIFRGTCNMPSAESKANDARVAELADAQDLGSCGETRGGSSPPFRTNNSPRGGEPPSRSLRELYPPPAVTPRVRAKPVTRRFSDLASTDPVQVRTQRGPAPLALPRTSPGFAVPPAEGAGKARHPAGCPFESHAVAGPGPNSLHL